LCASLDSDTAERLPAWKADLIKLAFIFIMSTVALLFLIVTLLWLETRLLATGSN
jgi:hypothetical protein